MEKGEKMKKDRKIDTGISFAHRGLFDNKKIPENSLFAFQEAIKRQTAIELDIQLIKNQTLVVFHDASLKRMTGKNQEVGACTYQELQALKLLQTNEHIPTLQEVLELVNGRVMINIEIKSTKDYRNLCQLLFPLLDAYQGDFLIQSFDFRILRYCKKKRPLYMRGLLVKEASNMLVALFQSFLLRSAYLKLDFISHHRQGIERKSLQKLRKKKLLFVWTIKEHEKEKYQNVVDGFIFERE